MSADPRGLPAAVALLQAGQAPEAERVARAALGRRGDDRWRAVLARALLDQKRDREALDEMAAGARDDLGLCALRGLACRRLDRLADALAWYDRAIAIDPNQPSVHVNRGAALQRLNQVEAALAAFDAAIAIDPSHAGAHFNRALALLQLGRYGEGWLEYEWRYRRRETPLRHADKPLWRGGALDGRTLLVHMEQGYGDAIQFVRYVPLLARHGGRVVIEVRAPLVSLFQGLAGIDRVVARGEPIEFDCHVPAGTLPFAFGTTVATIPATMPYLVAAPGPPPALEPLSGIRRAGLVWAGSPTHVRDAERSLPFAPLAPLFEVAGWRMVGLQSGPRAADIAPHAAAGRADDLSASLPDFAATARAVAALDLVITVDSAVAHLAGALGRTVWTLIPFAADWRWLLGRDDSPWYPTMRLFRQRRRGDWTDVVGRVAAALTGMRPA